MELHTIDAKDGDGAQPYLDTVHVIEPAPNEISRSINRVLAETASSSKILPEDILEPYFLNDISGDMASAFINTVESAHMTDGDLILDEGTNSRKGRYGQSLPTVDSLLDVDAASTRQQGLSYDFIPYYPRLSLNKSSVIMFNNGGVDDKLASFLCHTSNAYRQADKDIDSTTIVYRVSIITTDIEKAGSIKVKLIELPSEEEYWGFLIALTKAIARDDEQFSTWSGKCKLESEEGKEKESGGKDDNTSSSESMLSRIRSAASLFTSQVVHIRKDHIELLEQDTVVYSQALAGIKAVALSVDSRATKAYMLEVELGNGIHSPTQSHQYSSLSIDLLGTNLEPLAGVGEYEHDIPTFFKVEDNKTTRHSQSSGRRVSVTRKLLVPLDFDEIENKKTDTGITSVAVLKPTTKESKNKNQYSVAAIDTIPFATAVYYKQSYGIDLADDGDEKDDNNDKNINDQETSRESVRLSMKPILNQAFTQYLKLSDTAPTCQAFEISIDRASGLRKTKWRGALPSTYCAVYLIDREGQRLGNIPGGEWKTDTVKKTSSPEWNTILLLEEEVSGSFDTVSHVAVVVKDASSVLNKPQHLGQVIIPIACFIEGTSAPLTLPLEATDKMSDQQVQEMTGEISLSVRLTIFKKGSKIPVSDTSKYVKRMSATSRASLSTTNGTTSNEDTNDSNDTVALSYTIRSCKHDTMHTFWPFRAFGAALGNTEGHVVCLTEGLLIESALGTGGVLTTCYGRTKLDNPDRIFVDYRDVQSAIAITNSVVSLSIVLKRDAVDKTKRKKSFTGRGDKPMRTSRVVINILVAPCPAKALQLGIQERRCFDTLTTEIHAFDENSFLSSSNSNGRNAEPNLTQMIETASELTLKLEALCGQYRADHSKMVKPIDIALMQNTTSYTLPSTGRRWSGKGTRTGATTGAKRRGSNFGVKDLLDILTPAYMSSYELEVVSCRVRIRSHAFRFLIMSLCSRKVGIFVDADKRSSLGSVSKNAPRISFSRNASSLAELLPEYSVTGVKCLFAEELQRIDSQVDKGNGLATELFQTFSLLYTSLQGRLMEYALFAFTLNNNEEESDTDLLLRDCLQELVHNYYTHIRDVFAPYLGSPQAFKRTPGQETKIILLQMAILQNDVMSSYVNSVLWYLRLNAGKGSLNLLADGYTAADVLQWYSSSLSTETQEWLGKTMKQVFMFRNNQWKLPWDIGEVEGKIVSSLPESVIRQMNLYLEVVDDTATQFTQVLAGQWADYRGKEQDPLFADVTSFSRDIHFQIIEAINKTLLLLAEEYQRALKAKRWSAAASGKGNKNDRNSRAKVSQMPLSVFDTRLSDVEYGTDPLLSVTTEEEANFLFLVACINDCGRICYNELNSMDTDPEVVRLASRKKLVSEFAAIADDVVLCLVRMIFVDLQPIIVDFSNRWKDPATMDKVLYTIKSYFVPLRTKIDDAFFKEIIEACYTVCVACFMFLLIERKAIPINNNSSSASLNIQREKQRFSFQEVEQLQEDFRALQDFFDEALLRELAPSRNSLNRLSYTHLKQSALLHEVQELLICPFSTTIEGSANMEALLRTITVKYEYTVAKGIVSACLHLRPLQQGEAEGDKAVQRRNDALQSLSERLLLEAQQRQRRREMDSTTATQRQLSKFYNLLYQIFSSSNSANEAKEEDDRVSNANRSYLKLFRETASDALKSSNDQKRREANARVLSLLRLDESADLEEYPMENSICYSLESNDERITVVVSKIEVTDLKTSSYFSSANPYVALVFDKVRQKTNVLWDRSYGDGTWAEPNIQFHCTSGKLMHTQLQIEVFDKERIRRKRLLGRVQVQLGGLALHRIESWFALSGGEYDGAKVFIACDLKRI